MPKVSQEHVEARREQILAGAQRCFARHGYAGATVARLEEEIGLSRGAIFNYFDGKQSLFVAVAMRVSEGYQRIFVEEGLEAAVRAMAAEDPELIGAVLETQARLRHDPEFLRRMEDAFERAPRMSTWIEKLQGDGAFRADVPAVAIAQFVGMVLNGIALRVVGGEETDVDSVLRLLQDAVAPRK